MDVDIAEKLASNEYLRSYGEAALLQPFLIASLRMFWSGLYLLSRIIAIWSSLFRPTLGLSLMTNSEGWATPKGNAVQSSAISERDIGGVSEREDSGG